MRPGFGKTRDKTRIQTQRLTHQSDNWLWSYVFPLLQNPLNAGGMAPTYATAEKTAGPWVEIDLDALAINYSMVRHAASGADVAAVVKCDAYGLGMAAVAARLAERENCRIFFVAYPEEGALLREILKAIRPAPNIYVFNGPLPETMALFEHANLIPVLNSLEQAEKWAARKFGAPAALHIDTGMNRLGAPLCELGAIAALKGLNITLAMSHLACASDPANPKNQQQRALFIEASAMFPDARKSLSASGGALMDKSYHFDLIRTGIALYGGSPFDEDTPLIKPVAALKAPVVQIRAVKPGDTVGYGATHHVTAPSLLATVALGYGDGFPRAASGKAQAVINGERAPIAGRISMDLITIDVSALKTPPKTGNIAEFFGVNLPIHEAATACGTMCYELLTGLGGRVDRRYV